MSPRLLQEKVPKSSPRISMSPNFRNLKSAPVFKLGPLMSQRRNKLTSLPVKLRDLMFSLMLLVLSITEPYWTARRKTGTSRWISMSAACTWWSRHFFLKCLHRNLATLSTCRLWLLASKELWTDVCTAQARQLWLASQSPWLQTSSSRGSGATACVQERLIPHLCKKEYKPDQIPKRHGTISWRDRRLEDLQPQKK